MEYLSVFIERREKLNKKIARGEKLLDGEHILISIIFIENNEGKFLMQKTSKEKGSKYSSTGGHVLENENSKDAIIREVKEKSGTFGWSWDFIFIPEGYDKTMGNYNDDERFHVWNTDGYKKLAEFLKEN